MKEDYDEAKRLKLQIEGVRQLGQEIAKLEVEKQKAVEIEDYDLAKALKLKIHEMRTRPPSQTQPNLDDALQSHAPTMTAAKEQSTNSNAALVVKREASLETTLQGLVSRYS